MTATAAATPATTFDADDFRARFNALANTVASTIFERDQEIHGLQLATLGKLNVFQLGTPGLAKSMLARQFCHRIGGMGEEGFFDIQIQRTTQPEELLGPMSLQKLDEDRFVRNPDRRLPRAHIALLDEFFKGSSAIINNGLKLLEEHQWDNDGLSLPAPLWFAICPSNECPTDAEFAAIRDRLALSYVSKPLQSDDSVASMLRSVIGRDTSTLPETLVTVDEIHAAQALVKEVTIDTNSVDSLVALRRNLHDDGVLLSDRRYVKAVQVMQANAWLSGRDHITIEDFRVLKHVLWTDPEDIRKVERAVLDLANPLDREASELLEDVDDLASTYERSVRDAATHEERVRQTVETHAKLNELAQKETHIREEAKQKGYNSDLLKELRQEVKGLAKKLKEGFAIGSDIDLGEGE